MGVRCGFVKQTLGIFYCPEIWLLAHPTLPKGGLFSDHSSSFTFGRVTVRIVRSLPLLRSARSASRTLTERICERWLGLRLDGGWVNETCFTTHAICILRLYKTLSIKMSLLWKISDILNENSSHPAFHYLQ